MQDKIRKRNKLKSYVIASFCTTCTNAFSNSFPCLHYPSGSIQKTFASTLSKEKIPQPLPTHHSESTTSLSAFFRRKSDDDLHELVVSDSYSKSPSISQEQHREEQNYSHLPLSSSSSQATTGNGRNGGFRILHYVSNPLRTLTKRSASATSAIQAPTPNKNSLVLQGKIEAKEESSRAICKYLEERTKIFFVNRSTHHLNLRVQADPRSNSFSRFIRGKIGTIHINFDRLALPKIKISGGGQFSLVRGADVQMLSFVNVLQQLSGTAVPQNEYVPKVLSIKRFSSPFDLQATNLILIQDDVMSSIWIKQGLRILLNRILKRIVVRTMGNLAVVAVDVETVEILDNGKLCCRGTVKPDVSSSFIKLPGADHHPPIPFELQSGLSIQESNSQVLSFPGIEMNLFPPVSYTQLNLPPIVNIPIHKWYPIDLDLGENCKIQKLRMCGRRKRLELSMWARITPDSVTIQGNKRKKGKVNLTIGDTPKVAKFRCDAGRWITKVGKFAEY